MKPTSPSTRPLAALLCAAALLFSPLGHANSEASAAVSLLPIASVAIAGKDAARSSLALPAEVLVSGASLTVEAIETSAKGTVMLLKGASDGLAFSLATSAEATQKLSLATGTVLTVSVISAGVVLSAAGTAVLFIPNALGEALLYNEAVS